MSDHYSNYWNKVKKELSNQLSSDDMSLWVDKIKFYSYGEDNSLFQLSVPSLFVKDQIERYTKDIEYYLSKIADQSITVEFVIISTSNEENIKEYSDDKNNNIKDAPEIETDFLSKTDNTILNNIHDGFTFDSFVIGSSNEFSAEVAKVVAKNPGLSYNPYFIWGDSGLGKTHLIKAILNYIKKNFPAKKVKYVTSEEFTNDFVHSIKHQTTQQFRIQYRSLDLLIVDDVQFFAKKEALQEELFHTFNTLADAKKQMIFSCDQPISKVKEMAERLKSRFAGGITVDLQSPDIELKMAIIENMADKNSLKIEMDVLEFLCSSIAGSIRDLKGAFYDLLAYSSIMKINKITLEVVKDRLKEKLNTRHVTPISVNKIIQVVSEYYNLKLADITGTKRNQSIVLARQVAMYISRQETSNSTTQIGNFFGVKHGTVLHATKKIESVIHDKKSILRSDLDLIINKLKS